MTNALTAYDTARANLAAATAARRGVGLDPIRYAAALPGILADLAAAEAAFIAARVAAYGR